MTAVVFFCVQLLACIGNDFYKAIAIAPFVVVPDHDFDQVAGDDFGKCQVDGA